MTKKQELLQGIEIVKNEHKKWVTYAEAKFNGLEVEEELTPVKHTECACGKMIAENGQIMYHLKSSHSLSKDHEEFHKLAKKLYDFMNNKNKGNIFTKRIADKKNNEIMLNYSDTMRKLSDNLLLSFDNIKNEIICTSEERINSLFKI